MIVPSIDLQGGQAVQLRQGKEHVLTDERDPVELAREFGRFGPVAVVDLDAALGKGDNTALVERMCRVAEVRAGGGIRDKERGRALLRAGAAQLVIGTAAEPTLLGHFAPETVVVALDHRGGVVVDEGWTRSTGEDLYARAERIAEHCGEFLCTFVEREGGLGGLPEEEVRALVDRLPRPVTVAGGVADTAEAARLARLGVGVQVGMSLYTGKLDLTDSVVLALDWDKAELIPTVVQDVAGQVLMLAYSSRESLARALREGKGIYYSRSRQELWEKGATSGHTQELLGCRADCDRDALRFVVRQTGSACHTGQHSCFGPRAFGMPRLFNQLKERRDQPREGSFTSKLLENPELLLRKVMEEAFEVTRAEDKAELRWEIADTLYFLSVAAVRGGLRWEDLLSELRSRHKD